ncbi:tetratricopeptide repeat protein [Candidatus Sumerlaeota bacterium]|nr:tetratricopeptide repeat protein [Candidatus Sumerlaeota bacterium]
MSPPPSKAIRPAKPEAIARVASAAPESAGLPPAGKTVAVILAGFSLTALVILGGSWSSYQLHRHTNRAEAALAAKDYKGALDHLKYILSRYPDAWDRLSQLGDCYLEMEKPEQALEYYQKSLSIKPDQDLKAKLGRTFYLLGRNDEAGQLFREALNADPNDPLANFYVALINMKQKNYAKAAFFFQGASSDPALFEKSRPYLEEIKRALLNG